MDDLNSVFEEEQGERSSSSKVVGGIGLWLLHIVMVTFALYSGAHGVNASLRYAGSSDFAKVAQIIGIVTIEVVLIGIYLSYLNGRITGASQTIAAGSFFAIGFALALAGIIADSQINSGGTVSPMITLYLRWGLPIAPGIMSLGALLIHVLSPSALRDRKVDQQKRSLEEYRFNAHLAIERAKASEELYKRKLQVISRKAVLRELGVISESPEFREAIKRTAIERAPSLFSEAGIMVDKVTIPGTAIEAPEAQTGEPEKTYSPNGSNGAGSFLP